MEATAESIRTGGFDADGRTHRISHPSTRTELGQLGATLNAMLDSIDDAFARQGASEARLRRFVADASHELRTPLTSIRGYAQLAGRQDDDPDGRRAGLARIESESVRMTRLVEDLLLLARMDEQPAVRAEQVELTELVTALAADAQAAEPERRVRVRAAAAVVVEADRAALSQAVLNLLANARAHTPAGTPIEVAVHVDAGEARIDVVDHGPGIPDGAKAQVFDRFARLDPARQRGAGGAGLGLAIVASIAAAHGGRVVVDDTPGGGATFSIVLPGATPVA
jgi:two-component system OmpR family sensor kinase